MIEEHCPDGCGGHMRRAVSANFQRPFQEHWNAAVGQPVRTRGEFRDALKRKAEAQFNEVGGNPNYVEVDPGDKTALGVTDAGLDETAKRMRDSGQTEPTKKLII